MIQRFKHYAKKLFGNKLTLMVIPHSIVNPLRVQFSVSFAVFMALLWTGVTSWATLVVVTNIDYWSMRVDNQVLKLKMTYFADQLKKSREFMGQVQEADAQLRQLLGMQSRQSILGEESLTEEKGLGGPEHSDQSLLAKTLSNRLWQISDEEIREQSKFLMAEAQDRLDSYKEISEYIARERGLFRSTPLGWPAIGRTTSHFGHRISPFHGDLQFHSGIDIANEVGTSVRSTADGIVQHADWEGGYGRLVIINHGYGFLTYYGHNSRILVKAGESVRRGQVIALMGSSGSSTGSHTHYEIWQNGRHTNPWKFLVATSMDDLKGGRSAQSPRAKVKRLARMMKKQEAQAQEAARNRTQLGAELETESVPAAQTAVSVAPVPSAAPVQQNLEKTQSPAQAQ